MPMTMNELENKLKEMNLWEAHINGCVKRYINQDKVIIDGEWDNVTDAFGVFQRGDLYCVFITDSERGIPECIKRFDDEQEACSELIELISLHERVYRKQQLVLEK